MQTSFKVLHVGCGPAHPEKLPQHFRFAGWQKIRLDIDPRVAPDILGTITDMAEVTAGSMDALYSSHNVEHLHAHKVPLAFAELYRVLKPGGFALLTCLDLHLQALGQMLAENETYVSPAGPITTLDIFYGFRPSIAHGNHFKAPKTGYTNQALGQNLVQAGFGPMRVSKRKCFEIWARAEKLNQ